MTASFFLFKCLVQVVALYYSCQTEPHSVSLSVTASIGNSTSPTASTGACISHGPCPKLVLPYFLGYGTVGFQQLLDNGDVQVVNENRILTFYNERGYRSFSGCLYGCFCVYHLT
jgi:hypothetical protein